MEFISTLVATAVSLGGFIATPPNPEIVTLPEAQLKKVCGTDRNVINLYGCFNPHLPRFIFVNESVKTQGIVGASTVLHEIVHYVQYYNGRMSSGYMGMDECSQRKFLELQALNIQEKWLEENNSTLPNLSSFRQTYKEAIC